MRGVVATLRLGAGQPGVLAWATGTVAATWAAAVGGEGGRGLFLLTYYLLCLALFAGVLGGEPARAMRRWLAPDRWGAGRLVGVAWGLRAVLAVAGLALALAVLGLAGWAVGGTPRTWLRTVAILLAGAGWATLLSAFTRGAFNVVGVLLLHGAALWAFGREAAAASPLGDRLAAALLFPPLAVHLQPPSWQVAVPLAVAAGGPLLAWWWLRVAEVPP